jgi:hypothetical protein
MAKEMVTLQIPFEALVASLANLSLKEKRRLWELLDAELAEYEDALWEKDMTSQAEIREARAAYETGDYVTLDEYRNVYRR